jgi:hypothetical protein
MSNILGNILVSLGFDGAGFFSGMDKAQVVAKNTGKEIEGAFAGIGGAIESALGPLGEFGGTLGSAFEKVGGAINEALQGVTEFAGGGGLGLIAGASAGVVAAVAAVDAAFIGIAIHATENANKIYEMSEKTGIAVSTLSAFSTVGKIFGVSAESMGNALEKLNKSAYAAANAPEGVKNAYTKLGIAVRDAEGHIRPTSDLLLDISDKFASMPDGVQKTALAMQLFGRAGAEMIPFLNEGKDGISEFTDAATKMGAVLTDDAAASAHQFQKDLSLLQIGIEGIENKIMNALVPALYVVADQFVSAMEQPDGALTWILNIVVEITKQIIVFGESVSAVFKEAGVVVGDLIAIMVTLGETEAQVTDRIAHLDFKGAEAAAKDGMTKVIAQVKYGAQESAKVWADYSSAVGKVFNPPSAPVKKERPQGDDSSDEQVKQEAAAAKQILDISDARYKEQAAQAEVYYSTGEINSKQLLDAQISAVNSQYAAHEAYFAKLKSLYADDPSKLASINAEQLKYELGDLTSALEGLAKANEKWDETTKKAMADSAKESLKEQAHDLDAIDKATQNYVKSLGALATAQQNLTAATGKGDYDSQIEAIKGEMDSGAKIKLEGWKEIEALDKAHFAEELKDLQENGASLKDEVTEAQAALVEAQKTGDAAQIKEAESFLNQKKALYTQNQADIARVVDSGNKKIADDQKQIDKTIQEGMKQFNSQFMSAFNGIFNGTESVSKAFKKMFSGILTDLADFVVQWLLKKAEMWLADKVLQQTATATQGPAQVMSAAAVGTANAIASFAAAPWPVDMGAPAFGATIGASIASLAPAAAYEGGGLVDKGGPAILHPKEMVLPADLSQGLQTMIKSANAPGRRFVQGPDVSGTNSQSMIQPHIASAANARNRAMPSVKMTVVTPDADSFRASQSQIHGKMHKSMTTAAKRNR